MKLLIKSTSLTHLAVQNSLADAQGLGSYLQQFIGIDELQTLLQAHLSGSGQTQGFVRTGSTGIAQVLGLANVYFYVIGLAVLTDYHTGIYLLAGTDKQSTALLGIEQTIGNAVTGLKCDQGTILTVGNISLVRTVTIEDLVHDTVTLGIGHELTTITDQATGRDGKLQTGVTAIASTHTLQFTLTQAQLLDDTTRGVLR